MNTSVYTQFNKRGRPSFNARKDAGIPALCEKSFTLLLNVVPEVEVCFVTTVVDQPTAQSPVPGDIKRSRFNMVNPG